RNTLRYQNRKRQKILRVTKKYIKEMANKLSMVFIFLGLLAIVCTTRAREVPSEKGLVDQKNFVGFGGVGGFSGVGGGGLGGLGGGGGGLGGLVVVVDLVVVQVFQSHETMRRIFHEFIL
ncbi:hypothetical protein AABB24_010305, partial [Solanum stoloniferum]